MSCFHTIQLSLFLSSFIDEFEWYFWGALPLFEEKFRSICAKTCDLCVTDWPNDRWTHAETERRTDIHHLLWTYAPKKWHPGSNKEGWKDLVCFPNFHFLGVWIDPKMSKNPPCQTKWGHLKHYVGFSVVFFFWISSRLC